VLLDPTITPAASHWFDGSILGILSIGAIWGFFRGVIRQFLWVLSLAAGIFTVWWLHAQLTAGGWQDGRWLYAGCAVIGFGVYWVLRKLCSLLTFIAAMEMTGTRGLLAGLIPSSALVWMAGLVMRWFGAQDHLGDAAAQVKHPSPSFSPPAAVISLWAQARHALDHSFLGRLVGWTDPVTPDAKLKLSKLLVFANHPGAIEKMPHADAMLNALHQPKVQALLVNSRVRSLVAHQDYAGLLREPALDEVLQDSEVQHLLSAL
jgi:hypothetical protein